MRSQYNNPHMSSPVQNVLVLVCGSVAASKAPTALRRLREAGYTLGVIATARALEFVTALTLATAAESEIYTDQEWFKVQPGGKHLELAHFPDAVVVLAATSDTMARAALGLSGDLASATLLSVRCPILWVPAMNGRMWEHPATQGHKATLEGWGHRFVGPVSGKLGTRGEGSGMGRMVEPEDMVQAVKVLDTARDLEGWHLLVTAGPTREYLDPVRFISNPSSGKMGYAVAQKALERGAQVTLVTGPVSLTPPPGAKVVHIESALELKAAVDATFDAVVERVDAVVMTAAVADYRALSPSSEKETKTSSAVTLELTPNPDILKGLGERKTHQILVGFAMETDKGVDKAADKARRKNLDFILLNYPAKPGEGMGFGADDNEVTLVRPDGTFEVWERMTKLEVGARVLDGILELWKERNSALEGS
jgi:phosphopantothenoylcysteine decarboxylase / phosphopantothenate---cysteine ligase